jgi:hypothetical protein
MSAPSCLLDDNPGYGFFIKRQSGLKDGLRIIGKAAFQVKKHIGFEIHSKSVRKSGGESIRIGKRTYQPTG